MPRCTPMRWGAPPGSSRLPPRLLQLLEASPPSALREETLASPSPPLRPAAPAQAAAPGSEPRVPPPRPRAKPPRPGRSRATRHPSALLTASGSAAQINSGWAVVACDSPSLTGPGLPAGRPVQ